MGVKYTIPFKSHDNTQWRIDISNANYSGASIFVSGVSEQCAILSHDVETTDDPFSVFIKSTLVLNIYNEGQIDVNELQQAQDKDFIISRYREGILTWVGYLVSEGIQQQFIAIESKPKLTINAICGLGLLADMPYVHNDLPGLEFANVRSPINYFRNILFTLLGITLPIRWSNILENSSYPGDDIFSSGTTLWSVNGEGFLSYQSGQSGSDAGPTQTCEYVLKGMLQSMQCRIYQDNGMWIIRRINDVAQNTIRYKQINGDLGIMTVFSGLQTLTKSIGGTYPFIQEDAVITVKQGVKKCKVTYNANVRENILPNGSQDAVNDPIFATVPLSWGALVADEPTEINSVPGLDGRTGYSTELIRSIGTGYFYMLDSPVTITSRYDNTFPIDTKVLIKRINFGFQFSPVNFPFFPGPDEVIDWTSKPLQLQVVLNLFGARYFLNDFGFWQTDEATITIVIDNMRLHDIGQVNFDKFQGIIMPEPTNRPVNGDQSHIQVIFFSKNGTVYDLDNISITIDNGNEVYESIFESSRNITVDTRELNISSSFSGYMLSNFMSSPFKSGDECSFKDPLFYEGTLTGLTANSIMRCLYKSSRIFNGSINTRNKNWSFDEIYTISTLGLSKFLPMNASYNMEKCEVVLVAMEIRNENPNLVEKYYSSNDNQLSN